MLYSSFPPATPGVTRKTRAILRIRNESAVSGFAWHRPRGLRAVAVSLALHQPIREAAEREPQLRVCSTAGQISLWNAYFLTPQIAMLAFPGFSNCHWVSGSALNQSIFISASASS
jgi:hypothetical protein